MSDQSQTHTPHILPLKVYLSVGAALLILTVITVAVAQMDLGPFNLVVALTIAVIKASLVAMFFMHLYYDNKMYALIFLIALVFLGIFIVFTLFDTMRRGDIYEELGRPIRRQAVMYDSLGVDTTGHSKH